MTATLQDLPAPQLKTVEFTVGSKEHTANLLGSTVLQFRTPEQGSFTLELGNRAGLPVPLGHSSNLRAVSFPGSVVGLRGSVVSPDVVAKISNLLSSQSGQLKLDGISVDQTGTRFSYDRSLNVGELATGGNGISLQSGIEVGSAGRNAYLSKLNLILNATVEGFSFKFSISQVGAAPGVNDKGGVAICLSFRQRAGAKDIVLNFGPGGIAETNRAPQVDDLKFINGVSKAITGTNEALVSPYNGGVNQLALDALVTMLKKADVSRVIGNVTAAAYTTKAMC